MAPEHSFNARTLGGGDMHQVHDFLKAFFKSQVTIDNVVTPYYCRVLTKQEPIGDLCIVLIWGIQQRRIVVKPGDKITVIRTRTIVIESGTAELASGARTKTTFYRIGKLPKRDKLERI